MKNGQYVYQISVSPLYSSIAQLPPEDEAEPTPYFCHDTTLGYCSQE